MVELILGGARSGKSAYAQQKAIETGLSVTYIATATADDVEMQARIEKHQAERPSDWQLVEEPVKLSEALIKNATSDHLLLIDCLTLWLNNLLLLDDENQFQKEIDDVLKLVPELPGTILFVSNETGLGIIPMGELTRRFCDEAGFLHQRLARLCNNVTFMVAGLPLSLK